MRRADETGASGSSGLRVTAAADQTRTTRSTRSKKRMPDYQRGSVSPGDELVREPLNDARFISGHAPGPDGYPRRDDGLGAHFFEDGGRGSDHRDEFL